MNLEKAYEYIKQQDSMKGREILYVGYTGSRFTGMDILSSDYDIFVICMPSVQDLYQGTVVSFRDEHITYGDKVEITVIDIRRYVSYLKKADLDTLYVVYAKEEAYFMPDVPLSEEWGRVRDCQSFILWTRHNRVLPAYFDVYKLFNNIYGRLKTEYKAMQKAMDNTDYSKVIKCGYRIDYLVEILHTVYNRESFVPVLTLGKMAQNEVKSTRQRAISDGDFARKQAEAFMKLASGEIVYFDTHPEFERYFKTQSDFSYNYFTEYHELLDSVLINTLFSDYLKGANV